MLLWTLLVAGTVFFLPSNAGAAIDCSQSLSGSSGILSSYNFPFDYRHNLSCTYRIVLGASTGPRTVCFRFRRFALERSTPFCSFDYVRFENIKYCGDGLWQYGRQTAEPESNIWNKHFCWPAKKNHFDVTFMSDNNLNGAGFYTEYHVLPGSPPSPTDNVIDTGYAPCAGHQWTCFNRRCVNRTALCDGKDNCGDGSDESYAHARCPAKSVLACDFSTDRVPSDGQCGFVQQDGQWFRTNKALSYGPRADHTNGTEGYFMYTDSDHSPAYLVSPELALPPHPDDYCVSFWYYVYGRPAAAVLQVYVGRVVTYTRPEWERATAEPDKWLRGEVFVRGDQPLQVTFGAVLDNGFSGVALDDISVIPGACRGGDVSCNFESTLCGWRSAQEVGRLHGNLTWERTNRLQSAAGPMADHSSTDGSGLYVLVRPPLNRSPTHPRALLLSPSISSLSSSPRCLRFWYYLTGNADDSAVVKVRLVLPGGELAAARWAQNSRYRGGWRQMALQLAEDKPYQILIEAILDGPSGQIALDELVLEEHACPEVDSGACADGEFLCGDGSCVPATHRCDGLAHCPDGSDEDWRAACPKTTTVAPTTVCPQDYFQCVSDGRCVPVTWVCDNFRDCTDGSDESHVARCEGVSPGPTGGISSVSPCRTGQFACGDGECIQMAARCDGVQHCQDSTDESNCTVGIAGEGRPGECGPSLFECATGGQCLSQQLVCDGRAHCPDGSDEDSSTAHCARPINTTGLGTTSAVALALCLVVALTIIILPIILCRRRKARQRRQQGVRPNTPDTVTPDISTISYGDDTSLSRPLEDSLRRGYSLTSSYRPGRRDGGRLVNPVNEFQRHIEQMDERRRQSCIENLERYMINPRRAQPLPPVPPNGNGGNQNGRREDDLVDPSEYILALRSNPGSTASVLHPPPYSVRDYQNLQCTYVPPDGSSEGADAPSSSGVYSLPPDDPPPPYDGVKNPETSVSQTLPLRAAGSATQSGEIVPSSSSRTLPASHAGQSQASAAPPPRTPTAPDPATAGISPYHVTPVHQIPDNPSLSNTHSSQSSFSNNYRHTPSSSISSRNSPSCPLLGHQNSNSISSGHHSPNHMPNNISPSHHAQGGNPSSHYNPSDNPLQYTAAAPQSPHSPNHQAAPPRATSPRHHPIYPRLGTLQVSRTGSAQHHPSPPSSYPHLINPSTSTMEHNPMHNQCAPHRTASSNSAPQQPPQLQYQKLQQNHHHHHQQQQQPQHQKPHHTQHSALPASHQLHQVQLQFLPSSSV